jgi:hypothetical protein
VVNALENKYLYKWWKKACLNLKIDGVDLYGGTRHSSTTALLKYFSPEEIRKSGTLHTTNRAFDRYLQINTNASKKIYEKTSYLERIKRNKLQT